MNDKWSEVILGRGEDITLLNIILVCTCIYRFSHICLSFEKCLLDSHYKHTHLHNDMVVMDTLTVFVTECNKNW